PAPSASPPSPAHGGGSPPAGGGEGSPHIRPKRSPEKKTNFQSNLLTQLHVIHLHPNQRRPQPLRKHPLDRLSTLRPGKILCPGRLAHPGSNLATLPSEERQEITP